MEAVEFQVLFIVTVMKLSRLQVLSENKHQSSCGESCGGGGARGREGEREEREWGERGEREREEGGENA